MSCDIFLFRISFPVQIKWNIDHVFGVVKSIREDGMLTIFTSNKEYVELNFDLCLSLDDEPFSDVEDEDNDDELTEDEYYSTDDSWETISSSSFYESEDSMKEKEDLLENSSILDKMVSSELEICIDDGAFQMEKDAPLDHYYYSKESNSKISFIKAVSRELNLLVGNLPIGIHVKSFENRIDLLCVLIIGVQDTPFEFCSFIFDIHLPENYPNVPPKVFYRSFVNGKLNPNLEPTGRGK